MSEDPFLSETSPDLHWATSNLGEAMPGVQTPLSWTLWSRGVEHAPREAAYQIGGLTRRERRVPVLMKDHFIRPFYGRPAIQVEFFTALGDRMPGTTGEATAVSVLGRAPDDIAYAPTNRRLPVIAWRLPVTHARTPARLREKARQHDAWYAGATARAARLDLSGALALLRVAERRLDEGLVLQTIGILSVMQPLHDAVVGLCESLGAGDASVLTGLGDDVFYLTFDELTTLRIDRDLIADRRRRRAEYQALKLPDAWKGMVEPYPEEDAVAVDTVSGIGVSAGVVEGVVRVLHEPDFDEVEEDEILVAPFTDPSWASIMFLSSALVVDIGGALSHAAVVAREMDIPCVVNTRTGTRDLRTGDRVRVDGRAGTVEILRRAG